ncbi:MAG: Asd/ArgC dimerization domain-containing protein [Deltaproteobacteria bacterium]
MRSIAIIGGGGDLAEEVVGELLSRGHDAEDLRIFDSEVRAGEVVQVGKASFSTALASAEALAEVDTALFIGDGLLARDFLPGLAEAGLLVVDATAFSRRTGRGTLVVPEVNAEEIHAVGDSRVFACPMPATTGLSIAMAPLHRLARVQRVTTTIFEPASQRGPAAIQELSKQTVAMVSGEGLDRDKFPETFAFNVRPYAAAESGAGWAFDEQMIAQEVATIFGDPPVEVLATIVRMPVFVGACQSIWLDLESPLALEEAHAALREAPSILLAGESVGDTEDEELARLLADAEPGPVDVAGSSAVHLARLRQNPARPESIGFWIVFDDQRKGVAMSLVATFERAWREQG